MDKDLAGEDRVLERFREYLGLMARLQVGRRLHDKVDLSGVVQLTLLEAHRGMESRQDRDEVQMTAWLRAILANNLADELRKLRAEKRDFGRERSLDAALDQSSSRLQAWLAAEQSSPSLKAMRHEQAVQLADALAALPEHQRKAVELHHLQGYSLADVAQEIGCSKGAVAGLLHRGLDKLRGLLSDDNDS